MHRRNVNLSQYLRNFVLTKQKTRPKKSRWLHPICAKNIKCNQNTKCSEKRKLTFTVKNCSKTANNLQPKMKKG